MWEHPITATQISTLQKWGFTILSPISKHLMCNDVGVGAMQETHVIAQSVRDLLLKKDST